MQDPALHTIRQFAVKMPAHLKHTAPRLASTLDKLKGPRHIDDFNLLVSKVDSKTLGICSELVKYLSHLLKTLDEEISTPSKKPGNPRPSALRSLSSALDLALLKIQQEHERLLAIWTTSSEANAARDYRKAVEFTLDLHCHYLQQYLNTMLSVRRQLRQNEAEKFMTFLKSFPIPFLQAHSHDPKVIEVRRSLSLNSRLHLLPIAESETLQKELFPTLCHLRNPILPLNALGAGHRVAQLAGANQILRKATLLSGQLPQGLRLDATTGDIVVEGQEGENAPALIAGIHTGMVIQLTWEDGSQDSLPLSLELVPTLDVTYSAIEETPINQLAQGAVLAQPVATETYVRSARMVGGTLPPGCGLDTQTGKVLLHFPAKLKPGSHTLQLLTVDAFGGRSTHEVTLVLTAPVEPDPEP